MRAVYRVVSGKQSGTYEALTSLLSIPSLNVSGQLSWLV